ncbi:glycosyltransferase [uncultured Roseobacter sp.]|uniref:glycosyltransferase n=1 Tax=uncultured Roseobacter sp. TaxID=114847 RepID=UPI00262DDB2B|nr:glycosyltransferase [uncultured Roseobacter sp.]
MSTQDFRCSYVLLTYNQASTVEEALTSALSQTGRPLEIVVTDDCSTDDTFSLIRKTVEGYHGPHRIILNRNEKNLGLAGNIGRAHDISSGDIIIAAAGDDVSLPHRSSRILDTFIADDPLLVCSYADVIGPNGEKVAGNFRTAAFYQSADLKKAARSKSLYLGATGAWHRRIYDKYGPLDPCAYEDLVFGFRAALEEKVAVIREELVRYRLGRGITSSSGYHISQDGFNESRKNSFAASNAVMRQRMQDAKTFGLAQDSPIWQILKKEEAKSSLGLSYYSDTRTQFSRKLLQNPILALYICHSESRRRRKSGRPKTGNEES